AATGGLDNHRLGQAGGGVQEHLRRAGRDRHVQAEGTRLDAADGLRPRQGARGRERADRTDSSRRRAADRGRASVGRAHAVRRALCLLALALVAFGAAGCGGSSTTLTVLAGSELEDLEPLLGQIQDAIGVRLKLDYVGTLDGTQQIVSGKDSHDLAWFSHSKYLQLLQQESGKKVVHAETPIMLSPVVLGVKHTVAVRLGWTGSRPVTWRDIAEAAKAGRLRFAMTNPGSSNSGFTALVGVASAFAGSADALDAGGIDPKAMADLA